MPQLNTMRVQLIQVRGGHSINQDIFFKSYGSTLLGGSPHQYIQYVPFDLFATYSSWLKKKLSALQVFVATSALTSIAT